MEEWTGSSPHARGLPPHILCQWIPLRIIPARAGFTGSAPNPDCRRCGSSPHARGLRRRPPHRGRQDGIIPARAGFTRNDIYERFGKPDHPRTRGVYVAYFQSEGGVWGSSPHARGLRGAEVHPWAPIRIIPARAGFTRPRFQASGSTEDHPRTRGVYPGGDRGAEFAAGSSPHARGLPDNTHPSSFLIGSSPHARGLREQVLDLGGDGRIIPARAGFTEAERAAIDAAADHPRTRGVYCEVGVDDAPDDGSSPHARGLRGELTPRRLLVRIIPARAGFTPARRWWCRRRRDHPRTRGVYVREQVRTDSALGSSPHARGLRGRTPQREGPVRIIPARAGFTAPSPASTVRSSDHPRTRGVYDVGEGVGLAGERIIPARAGFTPPCTWPCAARPDHPRTRGVYDAYGWVTERREGSSPHARGLLRTGESGAHGRRIIPARAGFTAPRTRGTRRSTDHPRTRGVYGAEGGRLRRNPGSSPHARGLRVQGINVINRAGIIPARAGFTLRPRSPRSPTRDHPRTRGVYRAP